MKTSKRDKKLAPKTKNEFVYVGEVDLLTGAGKVDLVGPGDSVLPAAIDLKDLREGRLSWGRLTLKVMVRDKGVGIKLTKIAPRRTAKKTRSKLSSK